MCPGDDRLAKGILIGVLLGGVGGVAAALISSRRPKQLPAGASNDYVAGYLSGVRSRYTASERDPSDIQDPQAFAMGKLDGKSATPPAYQDERAVRAWNEALKQPPMWETPAGR